MNIEKVKQWISENNTKAIENAWIEAVGQHLSNVQLQAVAEALKALVTAKLDDMAETLGWMLLSESADQHPAEEALEVARAILPALPANQELRDSAVELYKKVYGQAEHFEDFLKASGLSDNQSFRRALRTMDTCLAIEEGTFLTNRFDDIVLRVKSFNTASGHFQLVSPSGKESDLDPKLLADEFVCADESDFRILSQFRRDELDQMLQDDITAVLIGVCMARGGEISSPDLKELLVPKFIESGKWSGWWNRARTRIKRTQSLTLEGKSPALISYHPHGRSLEEELAAAVDEAIEPLDYLVVLQQYKRELEHRKLEIDPAFAEPIMTTLANYAGSLGQHRIDEIFVAALVIDAAMDFGMPAPGADYPTAAGLLCEANSPVELINQLTEPTLWPRALDALNAREDAPQQLEKLLTIAPAEQLDEITRRIRDVGRAEAIEQAVSEALANRNNSLQICVWLWRGPAEPIERANSPLELLSCLLRILQSCSRDDDLHRETRRDALAQIRSALSANKYKTYKSAVDEMDEEVAGTIKLRLERIGGLTDAVRENLLQLLREKHYKLFLEKKVDPWLDETVIYTTKESLELRQAQLKELVEVKAPANSKAIGEAAALGDLSENSEWESAIEEQRRLNGRIIAMQNELNMARVLQPEDVPTDNVGIGSVVLLSRIDNDEEMELTFLGPWESNVEKKIYSYKTPLAQAIIGKAVGDTVMLKTGGSEDPCKIMRIGSALEK